MLEAGFAAGHGIGCYGATASYGRQGHYGMLYSTTRELAWALRTMAYAAFIAPDGTPEGPYFASKVINNIAMIEGEHALPQTVSGADPTWAYNWGKNYFQYSQAANPSPLSFWRMGDCQDGTTHLLCRQRRRREQQHQRRHRTVSGERLHVELH